MNEEQQQSVETSAPNTEIKNRQEARVSPYRNETSWKPGQSGNPNGRPPKGYSVSDTIRDMMNERPEIRRTLAAKLLQMALKGDMAAIREILDRLEGKPTQKIEADVQTTHLDKVEGMVNELQEYVKSENDGSDKNPA